MPEAMCKVLGPLQLLLERRPVPLRGAKHQIVLGSLLIAKDRRISLGRMVDAVWQDHPLGTARKQIRNAASDLRNTLGPTGITITAVAGGYQLDIGAAGRPADAVTDFRAALEPTAKGL